MKVVIIVEGFDPAKGYFEYYLAKELTKMGHKVYVFTFGWSKHVSRTTLNEGFEVISIPHIITVNDMHVPNINGINYVIKFIKTEKPNIIHCQPLYSPLSLLFISYQRFSKYKTVGSLITGYYKINSTAANLKFNLVKIVTEHYVKNKTDSFFAINDGWKKVTLQLFNIPQQKISVIPLGADSELFKPNTKTRIKVRNQLGLSADDIIIVYTGNLIPPKGLHILIKAIAPIIKQNHKVKLLIIGKGEPNYTRHLKELCSNLKIPNNILFHPWVHKTKLPDFYNASDIAVWPGGPSISIIEAVSAGLPLIVKRSLLTKFAIAYGNGFAYEPNNVEELKEYLETLIYDHKLRNDMSKKARLLVEQKLQWKTIAYQYLDAYRSSKPSSPS